MAEREPTGIPSFDEMIEGGLPKGSVTLVSGSPGTGKSIFSQQYLYTGATKFKQKCMYISLEQRVPDIYEQALGFGWDFDSLEKQGSIKFMFIDISERRLKAEETYIDILRNEILRYSPKRLVIDSLSPLANMPVSPDELMAYGLISEVSSFMPHISPELIVRFQVHRLIMTLKDIPCTSIVISEIPKESTWLSSDKVSEFMADGVIVLHYLGIGATSNRSLVIEKMRGTHHLEDVISMKIGSKGIVVEKPEEAYKI